MIKKLIDYGNKYVTGKMENPNSLLARMLETSKNLEKSTDLLKKVYLGLWVFLGLCVVNYFLSVWYLKSSFVLGMTFLCFIGIFSSAVLFVVSTNYEYFNFWNRKRADIITIALYVTMTVLLVMAKVFCNLILPVILLIPIGHDITTGMVVWLARLMYLLFTALPGAFVAYHLISIVFQEENWSEIDAFKIRKIVDLRKDKEFKYDLNIIRRMDNGKYYTIKENDRHRHVLLNGVTGTGKTSTALIPATASDLDQKAYNEDYTKKEILARILSVGDVHPIKGLKDEEFSRDAFWAEDEEGKKFLKDLFQKAPSAGMTVLAPNADLADAVYELATIRGFKVNRIDPIPLDTTTGEMKPGFTGFNPFYISPGLSSYQRNLDVFVKSRIFSDVLQALYEQSGKSDPYFTSLNRNMTTMLSILILTTYPWLHQGGQPDPTAVQEVINDFSCVRKYIFALAKMQGIGNDLQSEFDVTADWIRGKKFGEYQFIISQLAYDLLGAGRTKMEEQARGLRVIINEFLTDPRVRQVLCAENTIDIDRALAKGEITVVNYALELGMSIATAFGLFFCLSFNQAVLRRPGPEWTRLPHYYYCDELPVLLHKDMEPIFTLFRQFHVDFLCAFQTSGQFERNEVTRYLKNVVISNVGHHIVYGNCSAEDAKLYESLAGKKLEFMEQKTQSETALSSINTSMSFSTRTTPQYVNQMEGYKIRNKDFQEVTVFGINSGDHVDPFDGKLSFLTAEQKEGKGRCHIDWSRFEDDTEEEEATFEKTFISVNYNQFHVEDALGKAELNYLKYTGESGTEPTDAIPAAAETEPNVEEQTTPIEDCPVPPKEDREETEEDWSVY